MYSVFVNRRPLKIAFFVNPADEGWQEQLDAIWKFNQEKWGGRYNPIIPTDGESLEEGWWCFLKAIDPDYIISTAALTKELVKELESRICPIEIELPNTVKDPEIKPNIFTYNQGIPILPTSSSLRKLARNFIFDPVLALVDSSEYVADKTIFRFILRSFGLYSNAMYVSNALEKVERRLRFKANDKKELIETLQGLSQPALNFVFPIQFPMLGQANWNVEFDNKYSYDDCLVIIGDSFNEQVFTWNKVFYARDTQPSRFNHVWIPSALAKDPEIVEALGLWLRRIAEQVHLCTFTLTADELNEIGNKLAETKQSFQSLYIDSTVFNEFPFPKYSKHNSHIRLSSPHDSDYFRAYNVNDGFEVKSPSQIEGLAERGDWIGEIYTEANRSHLYNYEYNSENTRFWWQFPRKNYLIRGIFQTNTQIGGKVKVNVDGIPCVQLPAKNPILKIKLPAEIDLIRHAVEGDNFSTAGGRSYYTSPSNIGRYLVGFLKIFGSLDSAYQVLSSRYWRGIFDVLSKRDLTKDSLTFDRVKNKLAKKANQWGSVTKLKNEIDSLVEYVIRLARETNFEGRILEYNDFLTAAQNELHDFNEQHKKDWTFDESALQSYISEMLELGILLIGLSQPCSRCGFLNWYQVDEVRQELKCAGCRFQFSLPAEPVWKYRLSSLAQQGISLHGLVPVALVLGQILRHSTSSFFFAPPLDFFTVNSGRSKNYELLGDLDIVCISDAKLIIGEVKLSQGLFDLKQMMKLADIAIITSADVLLFSALEIEPTKRTLEYIDKVKDKVSGTKVSVEWYHLEKHIFEPEPVR